jgi:hypothetical protein
MSESADSTCVGEAPIAKAPALASASVHEKTV